MISIIIATYNRSEKLRHTLISILKQSYRDFEVLVIDDGSNDDTEKMIVSLTDKRIKYFKLEKNSGAYIARNVGLEKSSGDYLFIWDSDDVLYDGALEFINNFLETHKEVDVLCAPADFYLNNKKVEYLTGLDRLIKRSDVLGGNMPLNTVFIVWRKSLTKDLKFLGPNIDSTFYMLLIKADNNFYHAKTLGRVNLLSDNLSETIIRKKTDVEKSIRRSIGVKLFLDQVGGELSVVNPRRYVDFCYGASLGLLLNNKKKSAIGLIKQAFKTSLNITNFALIKKAKYLFLYFFYIIPFSSFLLRLCFVAKSKLHT